MDDLLLQVHGDMRHFEEVRTLLLRMAYRTLDTNNQSNFDSRKTSGKMPRVTMSFMHGTAGWYEDPNYNYHQDGEWTDEAWCEAGYSGDEAEQRLEENEAGETWLPG